MGIRMDQHMGLNEWAMNFVKGEEVLAYTEQGTRLYPDGREEEFGRRFMKSSVKSEPSGSTYSGMFEDIYRLSKYTFPDGRVFYDAVQSDEWSSGPCFFLALKDNNGEWVKESLWSDEEIADA